MKSKEQRLATARDKVDARRAAVDTLKDELEDDLSAIDDKWSLVAADIEELEIGLERTDITVENLTLAWLPV